MTCSGYTPEEVLGKTFLELLTPEDADRVGELLGPILEARKPYVYVGKTSLHRHGKRVVLESSGVPIADSRGNFLGYRGIDRNITERQRATEALFREKEKYRTLGGGVPLRGGHNQPRRRLSIHQPQVRPDFRVHPHRYSHRPNWFPLAFPDAEYRRQVIADWFEGLDDSQVGEARLRSFTVDAKDGSRKIINFRAVTLMTGNQLVIYEDVTEHHRAEAALRESETKYRLLVANIPAVVFRGYADWSVEFFDDKVEELTGYSGRTSTPAGSSGPSSLCRKTRLTADVSSARP